MPGPMGKGAAMCRLFAMHAGTAAVPATFWLIDAPDSLAAQSRRNPDGAGVGTFGPDARAIVDRQPRPAWSDPHFASAARDLRGTTFVAHVRYASTGARTVVNTHPFLQDDRLFAHNGVVLGLPELDAHLDELGAAGLVRGQTDSERVFALVTAQIARHSGDVGAGVEAAIGWVIAHLPLYALNFVMATATDLWALRYPATHELYLLDRPAGGSRDTGALDARTDRIHARAAQASEHRTVLVASEPMDDDPGWRLLDPGELVHVAPDLTVVRSTPFPARPTHQLTLAELDPPAATSQHPGRSRP